MDMVSIATIRAALRAALVLALVIPFHPTSAQDSASTAEISATVQRYIDALKTRDTAYIRTASLPQATLIAIAVPALPNQAATVRTVGDVIAGLAHETRRFDGRVWSPRISIEHGIAIFIAPYDAWYDGRFSHCGIDHYILVRSGNLWLVSQLVFTRQREGCAPAPMGPPN
jgi:hypothetical protein